MIKAINPTRLNTTKELFYKCNNCGKEGTFILENSIIETDNNGKTIQALDYECPECNKKL